MPLPYFLPFIYLLFIYLFILVPTWLLTLSPTLLLYLGNTLYLPVALWITLAVFKSARSFVTYILCTSKSCNFHIIIVFLSLEKNGTFVNILGQFFSLFFYYIFLYPVSFISLRVFLIIIFCPLCENPSVWHGGAPYLCCYQKLPFRNAVLRFKFFICIIYCRYIS